MEFGNPANGNYDLANFDSANNLEPRLLQYIQFKNNYAANNLRSTVSLEKQLGITKEDILKIKNHMKGQLPFTNTNPTEKYDEINDKFVKFDNNTRFWNDIATDPRMEKIALKAQREKDAVKNRNNIDDLSKNYDFFRNNMASAGSNNIFMDSKDHLENNTGNFLLMPEKKHAMQYDNPSRQETKLENVNVQTLKRKKQPYNMQTNSQNSQFNAIQQNLNFSNEFNKNYVDNNFNKQSSAPNIKNYSKKINDTYYHNYENENQNPGGTNNRVNMPYMSGNGIKDTDMESYMQRGGVRLSGQKKAMGYKNPVENYYQYIDNDIQTVEHTVNPRGVPTRSLNKSTHNPYRQKAGQ